MDIYAIVDVDGCKCRVTADELIRVCKKNKTKLGVIFQMRFGSVVQKLKQVIDSGALGRIILADAFDKECRTPDYYKWGAWRGTKRFGP